MCTTLHKVIGTRGGREEEGCHVKVFIWFSDEDYMLVASVPVAARAMDCRMLSLLAGLAISAMPAITRPYRVGEREIGET